MRLVNSRFRSDTDHPGNLTRRLATSISRPKRTVERLVIVRRSSHYLSENVHVIIEPFQYLRDEITCRAFFVAADRERAQHLESLIHVTKRGCKSFITRHRFPQVLPPSEVDGRFVWQRIERGTLPASSLIDNLRQTVVLQVGTVGAPGQQVARWLGGQFDYSGRPAGPLLILLLIGSAEQPADRLPFATACRYRRSTRYRRKF